MLDEMVEGGAIRPHWRALIGAIGGLGRAALEERAQRLERAAVEEGAAAMLPGGGGSAWRCDPVPLPLTAAEFAILEAGLAQRARMLEALLADLYGPQRSLAEGVLPPALVFGNPGFLRPWRHGSNPPRRPLLHLYAAELVRAADGCWHVATDRTGLVSGLGVAQENRRLMGQAMPEAFRTVKPRGLSTFFDLWQDALQRLRHAAGAPAVAMLTPGHQSPHWFEHVVLSREIGAALVEPGDLTVRGGALFLKTLAGLQPVDVLVSRLEADALDPLEFPGADAASGVPGLLDAARHGTLTVVNAPGAALAESPGLLAYSDALHRFLLDEEPLLPVLPTRWLPPGAALAGAGPWLLRPALDGIAGGELRGPGSLPPVPGGWAASEWPDPSAAPCFSPAGLAPMPVVLRLFSLHLDGGWHTMPGGLARVLEADARPAGRLAGRGWAKDVWVLAEDEALIMGPGPQALPPLPIRRSAGALPSRVADNLFWLGRYVERLDRAARLVRATLSRLRRGRTLPREMAELHALARCLVDAGLIEAEAVPSDAGSGGLAAALAAAARPSGAVGQLQGRIAALTGLVRERLTGDMHATFTQSLRAARAAAETAGPGHDDLSRAMVANLRFATAVAGVASENMVRGGAWLFLELGRRLERAQAVLAELGVVLGSPAARSEAGLRLVLELCDSVITYRSRYLSVLQAAPVLDLVLADPANPRGLAFQLAGMQAALAEVAGEPLDALADEAGALRQRAEALVQGVLAARDQAPAAAALPPELAAMSVALAALSDAISRRYFALLPVQRALTLDSDDAPASATEALRA